MTVSIKRLNNDGETVEAVEVDVTGKLHKADYEEFLPVLEEHYKKQGSIRLVFYMYDFHGWDLGALWADLKFDFKHFKHFERIAMVGDKRWEKWMAVSCKPFTTGKVKYFDLGDKEEAAKWVLEETEAAA